MRDWVIRNFISREANVVLKINKNPNKGEYCTQAWAASIKTWKAEGNIDIEGGRHTKKIDKYNKKVKDFS